MYKEGKSRAEAERFLMGFKQGQSYLPLLDQIYASPEPLPGPPRRGIIGRIRGKSQ